VVEALGNGCCRPEKPGPSALAETIHLHWGRSRRTAARDGGSRHSLRARASQPWGLRTRRALPRPRGCRGQANRARGQSLSRTSHRVGARAGRTLSRRKPSVYLCKTANAGHTQCSQSWRAFCSCSLHDRETVSRRDSPDSRQGIPLRQESCAGGKCHRRLPRQGACSLMAVHRVGSRSSRTRRRVSSCPRCWMRISSRLPSSDYSACDPGFYVPLVLDRRDLLASAVHSTGQEAAQASPAWSLVSAFEQERYKAPRRSTAPASGRCCSLPRQNRCSSLC